MGGNAQIKINGALRQADKINLNEVNRATFISNFIDSFEELDKLFYKKYNKHLYNTQNLFSGQQFNGSTSYIFDRDKLDEDILPYKSTIGDIDIIIPKELKRELWDFLKTLENQEINKNIVYLGPSTDKITFSSIGETLIVLFKYNVNNVDLLVQIDFEFLDVDEDNNPTNWARFSHSSSLEDAKLGIKAFHHKYLIQALVGAASLRNDIIIATNMSTPDNIKISKAKTEQNPRMLKFSVSRGLRYAYEPMLNESNEQVYYNNKKVYKKINSKTSYYITDLDIMFEMIFKDKIYKNKFWSFIGITELMKKYLTDEEIQRTFKRYEEKLFGKYEQVLERNNPAEDFAIKNAGYAYIFKELNESYNEDLIAEYYDNFKGER